MSGEYVLLWSLGPVQSFISESRRTQDLFAGSRILSELAHYAAKTLNSMGRVIYPSLDHEDDHGNGDSLPNKVVVLVSDPADAAQAARQAVSHRWAELAEGARHRLQAPGDDEFNTIWTRQLDGHLEFWWSAAPFDGDYPKAYAQAAGALEARKRTRNFSQSHEDGVKDALSGRRSALRLAKGDARRFWGELRTTTPGAQHRVRPGECLDAIGAVKRFYSETSFPSTSTVASASFVRACARHSLLGGLTDALKEYPQIPTAVDDFRRDGFRYDGRLVYDEVYQGEQLRREYGVENDLPRAQEELRRLYRRAEEVGIAPSRPTPYYAILAMDGDRMGEHIRLCRSPQEHTELSRRLGDFAARSCCLIRSQGAYPVYTGGDDLLALSPLEGVLQITDALGRAFAKKFADWCSRHSHHEMPFTVSAGVAIVHRMYPLSAALTEARDTLEAAKQVYDRNAVCVSLNRRSGKSVIAGSPWNHPDGGRALDLVDRLARGMRAGSPARGLVAEFYDQVSRLEDVGPVMLGSLLRRLWARHTDRQQDAVGDHSPVELDRLLDWVSTDERAAALELARWLWVTRFLAQGGRAE